MNPKAILSILVKAELDKAKAALERAERLEKSLR